MNTPAVAVRGLVKRYGAIEAVRGIDLEVARGETFGFLGPNGAGKSTTINILCTLVEPTDGEAEVVGLDVVRERAAVRRRIGLVFQDPTLDAPMSGEQNLRFHQELYGVDRRRAPARREEVMRMVGLWDRRADPVATYSGGMRRRLEIARGPAALAPGALPRRADDRPRPADPRHRSGTTWRSCTAPRRSPSSSPPTTWTRPSTATGSRS